MPDSAITTKTEKLSRPGPQPAATAAPVPRPRTERKDPRPLTDLAHDEWCELCDDLERWLEG